MEGCIALGRRSASILLVKRTHERHQGRQEKLSVARAVMYNVNVFRTKVTQAKTGVMRAYYWSLLSMALWRSNDPVAYRFWWLT